MLSLEFKACGDRYILARRSGSPTVQPEGMEESQTMERSQSTSAQTPATGVKRYSRKRKLTEDVASPARSASSPLLSTTARTPSTLVRSSPSSSSSPSLAQTRSGASKWEDILNSLESSSRKEEEESERRVPEFKRARVEEDDDTAEEAECKPDEHEEDERTEEKGKSAPIEQSGTATTPSTPGKKQRTVQLQLHFGASSPGRASSPSPLSLRSPSSTLKKKNSDSAVSAKASRTPTKPGKSRRSKAGDGGAVRQMYLDLGQEKFDWVTCSVCEMLYAPGVPSDEKTHHAFHQRFLKMQASSSAPRESRTNAW